MKPLTMTEDEDKALREASAADTSDCHGCAFSWQDVAKCLLREVDAQRRLPVIATCRHCGWSRVDVRRTPKGKGLCAAATLNPAHGYTLLDAAPPDWCPLRGAS